MTVGSGGTSQVRVMSYNVRAFKDDTAALAQIVREAAPDVLLLQEVPRHPFSGHRVASFAQRVGMTWSGGRRWRMSTTLLTGLRLDVHSHEHRPLPVRPHDEPRGYAVAQVALPGHRPFQVASLHMSLRGEDRARGGEQMLLELDPAKVPTVMGGDLNEEPGRPLWKALDALMQQASEDGLTFPSIAPIKRIDAIHASAPLKVVGTPALQPSPLYARATDHLPLVVDLDVSALAR